MNKRTVLLLSFIVVFVAILIPSLHVPMQSDDFAYYSLGLSLDAQFVHYMGWSGRIVTNTISSYLLNLLPHVAYEIVNSLVFALLMLFVCILPYSLSTRVKKASPVALLIIFTLYWIANPALGETSFWIVGSTNYLWTSMFVTGYFVYLFRSLGRAQSAGESLAGFVLGLLAGCSNENTSVVVVLITLFMIFVENNRRVAIFGLVGSVIGALVLILSPGNKSRANSFVEWKSLSFVDKFDLHFYERLPGIMATYWQVYLVVIVTLFVVCLVSAPNRKQLQYAGVFFIGAVLANMAFVASPFVPERAYNGALVLMLVSLSFVMSAVFESDARRLKAIYTLAVSCFILLYFIPSYVLFSNSVISVWAQSKIRESIILEAKSKGLKEVEVPSYYYTKLLKASDKLASFDNNAVDLYYGVDKITYFTAQFNYAGIEDLPKIDVNLPMKDGVLINRVYAYDDGMGRKSKLLFRVEGNINEAFGSGVFMYVHVFLKDGTYVNRDTAVATMRVNGSDYTFAELGVDYHAIERIELGLYRSTGTLSSFVIKEPKFLRSQSFQ